MARNTRFMAREIMQKFAYDPMVELITQAQDDRTSQAERRAIAEELMPYMYPKLSAVIMDEAPVHDITAVNQRNMMMRVLNDPELADAAQKLSIAASKVANEALEDYQSDVDDSGSGTGLQRLQ